MIAMMKSGSTGPDVTSLQQSFNYAVNPKPPLVVDGVFGPMTRASVVRFQNAAKLSPDGVVGPLTRAALTRSVLAAVLGVGAAHA